MSGDKIAAIPQAWMLAIWPLLRKLEPAPDNPLVMKTMLSKGYVLT